MEFRVWGFRDWGLGFRGLGFRVHGTVETSARFTGVPHTVWSSKKTDKRDVSNIFLGPYGMALTFT